MRKTIVILFVIFIIAMIGGCGGGSSGNNGGGGGIKYQLYGMDFSPYIAGGSPNNGNQVTLTQINTLLNIIQPLTTWVGTYSTTNGEEQIAGAAKARGLKVAAGCRLGKDAATNRKELDGLEALIKAKQVDLAVIGNEVLLRGDLTEDELIASIREVKALGVSVTTRDTWNTLRDHPKVMAECDVILANFFPYWEGVKIDQAAKSMHQHYLQLKNAVGDKEVIVGETGWPSAGNAFKDAVPSPENAAFFFLNVASWAQAENIKYFYFEAFDEPWKEKDEGPQGAHWGLWDVNMKLKPGMEKVFDGQTIPNNWSDNGDNIAPTITVSQPQTDQKVDTPFTVKFNITDNAPGDMKSCVILLDEKELVRFAPYSQGDHTEGPFHALAGKHLLSIETTDEGNNPTRFNVPFEVNQTPFAQWEGLITFREQPFVGDENYNKGYNLWYITPNGQTKVAADAPDTGVIRWSPNGQFLACGNRYNDQTRYITFYDRQGNTLSHLTAGDPNLSWLQDNSGVLSGAYYSGLYLSTPSGTSTCLLLSNTKTYDHNAVQSSDGEWVYFIHHEQGVLSNLYRIKTAALLSGGKRLSDCENLYDFRTSHDESVQIKPLATGQLIIVYDNTIELFDPSSKQVIKQGNLSYPVHVYYSSDGKYLACITSDPLSIIQIYDCQSFSLLYELAANDSGTHELVDGLCWAPTDDAIALVTYAQYQNKHSLYIWRFNDQRVQLIFERSSSKKHSRVWDDSNAAIAWTK